MPIFKRQTELSGLDTAISDLLAELENMIACNPDYPVAVEQLVRLHELKMNERPETVKADTLALVAGNIAVALIIVGFEQKNVLTTKVLGFLSKLR